MRTIGEIVCVVCGVMIGALLLAYPYIPMIDAAVLADEKKQTPTKQEAKGVPLTREEDLEYQLLFQRYVSLVNKKEALQAQIKALDAEVASIRGAELQALEKKILDRAKVKDGVIDWEAKTVVTPPPAPAPTGAKN